jgi:hypothetical protein
MSAKSSPIAEEACPLRSSMVEIVPSLQPKSMIREPSGMAERIAVIRCQVTGRTVGYV